MNEKIYRAQIAHLRRCIDGLRLIDLDEVQRCAEQHGTEQDRALIDAVRRALETLPPSH